MTDNTDLIAELEAKDPRDVGAWSDLLDRAATALRAADAEIARLTHELAEYVEQSWKAVAENARVRDEIARLTDEADTAIQQATNMAEDVESLRAAITAALATLGGGKGLGANAYRILSDALSAQAPVSQPSGAEGVDPDCTGGEEVGRDWGFDLVLHAGDAEWHRPRTRAEYEQEQN